MVTKNGVKYSILKSGVFTASKTMNDSGKTMNINKYSGALSAEKIREFFIGGG